MDYSKYNKAIAGFIGGLIVMWLTKHNVVIADNLADSLEIVIGAALTALTVFIAPRNKA